MAVIIARKRPSSPVVEAADEAEVEEGDRPAPHEEVVAGMGVAVEGRQPVEAAEDEAVQDLADPVLLVLVPAVDLGERGAGDQLGGEHPVGRQVVVDGGDADEGVAGVEVGEELLVRPPPGGSPAPRRGGPSARPRAGRGRGRGTRRRACRRSDRRWPGPSRWPRPRPGTGPSPQPPGRRGSAPGAPGRSRRRRWAAGPSARTARSGGRPSSASTTEAASSADMAGASACSWLKAWRNGSGRPSST